MKLILKILIWFSLISVVGLGIIIGFGGKYLNEVLKYGLLKYINGPNYNVEITDLNVKGRKVYIKSLTANLNDGAQLEAQDIIVLLDFKDLYKNYQLSSLVTAEKLIVKNNQAHKILEANFKAENIWMIKKDKNSTNIVLDNLKVLESSSDGKASCSFDKDSSINKVNCKLNLSPDSYLRFDSEIKYLAGKLESIKTKGEVSNINMIMLQLAEKVMPNDETLKIINLYIKEGIIESGVFDVSLGPDFFSKKILKESDLKADFKLKNFVIKYDPDFPLLTEVEGNLTASSSEIILNLKKAYINQTPLDGGLAKIKFEENTKPVITIATKAAGPATDLLKFVPAAVLEETKNQGIDLMKLTGKAATEVNIIIPFDPNLKNTYDIKSEVLEASLEIFNGNIALKQAKINASFDGDRLELISRGKINEFNSDINYVYHLNENDTLGQLLNIKTKVEMNNYKYQGFRIHSGNCFINFEYKNINESSSININSDLTDLDFYIDKISIRKLKGEKANLNINGILSEASKNTYQVKVSGQNNLNIVGKVTLDNKNYNLSFPIIEHKDTSVKALIEINPNELNATLEGDRLDLSQGDMMQFLKKGKALSNNTNVKLDINKVMLKNGVLLRDLKMKVKCTQEKCYKGYLDSKLGSKFLKMLLNTFDNKEEWVITSNNAGAVFKGFGLYNNMKAGSMMVVLNTLRKELNPGEIVPILDGSFTFKKFAMVDTPILTRMVSFISLPGFVNFITNNKDIVFSELTGKFSYNKNLITLSNAYAQGPFFDFTMGGEIETKKRKIKLTGRVVPSLYGISSMIKHIPIIGNILSGGNRKGIVTAPYSVNESY